MTHVTEARLQTVSSVVRGVLTDVLGIELDTDASFLELGFDSVSLAKASARLGDLLGIELLAAEMFAYPSVEALSAYLSPRLVHGDAESRAVANTEATGIEPVERGQPTALSFAQERLWFLAQLQEEASRAYNIPAALRLRGKLNRTALRAALDRIVARHESLRTRFVTRDGVPTQEPLPENIGFALLEQSRNAQLYLTLEEEARNPFDLGTGPLARGRLIELSEDECVFVITMHHIVTDGWSMGVFFKELRTLYEAFSHGDVDPLPALQVQYADYSHWQRQWLQGSRLHEQEHYWQETLSGAPALLALPTDHPRPPVQDYRGADVEVALDSVVTQRLRALGERHGATLYMVLLASWAALMSRLSGQDDIVIGTPVANRRRTEIEGLIGLFVNTLAMRVDLSGDPSTADLLRRVRSRTLETQSHQDLPFERVVELVKPERTLAHGPIFQAMLVWQNLPEAFAVGLPGLRVEPFRLPTGAAHCDLSLMLWEADGGVAGTLTYASSLFEPATVQRYLGYWRRLLEGMVADEQCAVGRLGLLDAVERKSLMEWNDAARQPLQTVCIHELIRAQSERTPGATAVVCGSEELTYAQLTGRANQLARYLRELGVKPDVLVAVCLERSLEMVVGVLAVLKAGGAYVPLDPSHPAERLQYMLEHSAAPILLTRGDLQVKLSHTPARVIDLDRHWADISEHSEEELDSGGLEPRHLAYTIYTSGSTGKPKGVMVEHASVVNALTSIQATTALSREDRWLATTTLAFDIAALEIYVPLICGARLIVAERSTAMDPLRLARMLEELQITVMQATPTTWKMLLASGWRGSAGLKALCGGEALPGELARQLRPLVWELWNLYGPTETTIWSTIQSLHEQAPSAAIEPLGRPIANTQVYVLDAYRAPVPVGVAGEICIAGAGVARGYLKRPDLTSERFLANPFVPGQRLYATGDLGRWRPDGTLEYLGRSDHQVKVRGFRIELGEIEAQLLRHPQVREAVLVAQPVSDAAGEKRLVAYYTGDAGARAEQLRAYLLQSLPDYMVPAAFVMLEHLPLGPNGKLDRHALPLPDEESVALRRYVAPRSELERTLCEVWESVLELERISIEDNFFAAGGDSILSVQVVARARARSVPINVSDLFRYPTVAQLAAQIDASSPVASPKIAAFELLTEQECSQYSAAGVEDAYPLSALQEGMYFHSELDPPSAVYHDLFSFRVAEGFHREWFEQALRALVQRHPVLRTGFELSCSQRMVQVVHREPTIDLRVLELTGRSEPEQEHYIQQWLHEERHQPFTWAVPPLWRVFIHVLTPDRFQYGLSCHHAILDGWSIATFHAELMDHYASLVQGRERVREAPAARYRDFVAFEQQARRSLPSQQFWRDLLDPGELPPDRLRRPGGRGERDVEVRVVSFPMELCLGLQERARSLGVHPKLLLLAAHVKVMSVIQGVRRVVTGLASHGRLEEQDGERVLGLHLNCLPLQIDLACTSWRELIGACQDQERSLLAHRFFPLSGIQKLLGGAPLFDSLFNFIHQHLFKNIAAPVNLSDGRVFEMTNFAYVANFVQRADGPGVSLSVSFDRSVFDPDSFARVLAYYERALRQIVENVDASHQQYSLLDPEERDELLVEFNRTEQPYPGERPVHELFEAQVARAPRAIAVVVHDGASVSYADLNQRANQLARYLREQGVQIGERIALSMPRSIGLLVAQLAILKCGGTYVPIDPAQPSRRTQLMLRDCGARWIIATSAVAIESKSDHSPTALGAPQAGLVAAPSPSQESLAEAPSVLKEPLAVAVGVRRIDYDKVAELLRDYPAQDLGLRSTAPAYVMYTSGSTGEPKGVVVTHRAINRLVHNNGYAQIGPEDCIAHHSNPAFDASTFEVWGALLNGARVLVVDQAAVLEAQRFAELLRTHAVSTLFLTTALFNHCAREIPEALRRLKYLLFGGEACDPRIVAELLQGGAQCCLMHVYGPTECTTFSTWYRVKSVAESARTIPIGRPISNTRVYVLDAALMPVPIGVPGEIYIGGPGVALGYLNRPELTSERFIASPFISGDRLYKTGDIGCWRPDGVIEFLGRTDHQVKIRGFRIELGEIEEQIARHPQVKEAIVLAREGAAEPNASGDKRLVAYVVARQTLEPPSVESLRAHLKGSLPDYMVPTAFVMLDNLPLTRNGKVDRSALPTPEAGAYASKEYEPPRGEMECALARIWQEVLEVDRVGRHDNFFELGGHSLLATRLTARIRASFSVHLPLRALFEANSLAHLAEHIEHLRQSQLREKLAAGGADVERILARVARMQGGDAAELARKLRQGKLQ